jgi:DNA-binding winged helix-turn-helix (wHTH) protein
VGLGRFGGNSRDAQDPLNLLDIIRGVSVPAVVRFHGFILDEGRRHFGRGDQPVHLTRKAFDFLVVLIAHAPQVVTKADLHRELWCETFVTDATVASVVKELRAAFRDHGCHEPLIRTAHGVGYAFAGTIERRETNRGKQARCCLIAGSRRVVLAEGDHDIGRDPDAAVWLDSPQVSRRHARITVADDEATLQDLGSKNRTLVNDRRISEPTRLHDGDAVQIGSTVFVFRVMNVSATTETAASACD